MKAAFLDRDGTLCRDYPDAEWVWAKYPKIDLDASFLAGDSPADREPARRCGLRFYGADTRHSLYGITISLEVETDL